MQIFELHFLFLSAVSGRRPARCRSRYVRRSTRPTYDWNFKKIIMTWLWFNTSYSVALMVWPTVSRGRQTHEVWVRALRVFRNVHAKFYLKFIMSCSVKSNIVRNPAHIWEGIWWYECALLLWEDTYAQQRNVYRLNDDDKLE